MGNTNLMRLINRIKHNHILTITIGIVYIWFGILKFFPSLSPAEDIAINTIDALTMGLLSSKISIILLALWESVIGTMLLFNLWRKQAIIMAFIHMACTFTPLIFFPHLSFTEPFCFTLLGQYIVKNIIIIGALYTVYKMPAKTLIPHSSN